MALSQKNYGSRTEVPGLRWFWNCSLWYPSYTILNVVRINLLIPQKYPVDKPHIACRWCTSAHFSYSSKLLFDRLHNCRSRSCWFDFGCSHCVFSLQFTAAVMVIAIIKTHSLISQQYQTACSFLSALEEMSILGELLGPITKPRPVPKHCCLSKLQMARKQKVFLKVIK